MILYKLKFNVGIFSLRDGVGFYNPALLIAVRREGTLVVVYPTWLLAFSGLLLSKWLAMDVIHLELLRCLPLFKCLASWSWWHIFSSCHCIQRIKLREQKTINWEAPHNWEKTSHLATARHLLQLNLIWCSTKNGAVSCWWLTKALSKIYQLF